MESDTTYCGERKIYRDNVESTYLGRILINEAQTSIDYNEINIKLTDDHQKEGIGTAVLKFIYQKIVPSFLGKEYAYVFNPTGSRYGGEVLSHKFNGIEANVGADLIGSIITQLRAGAVIFDYTGDTENAMPVTNILMGFPAPSLKEGYELQGNKEIIKKLQDLCSAFLAGGEIRKQALKEYHKITGWTSFGAQ